MLLGIFRFFLFINLLRAVPRRGSGLRFAAAFGEKPQARVWEYERPGKRLFKTSRRGSQLGWDRSEEVPCTILSGLVLSAMSQVLEAPLLGDCAERERGATEPAPEGLKAPAVVVLLFAFVLDCSLMVN